jgi:hypothetical protein
MSDFHKYFKENMESLGVPAPETLFGSTQMAVSNAAIFLGHIDKYGKSITVGELIGAGTKLEQLGVVAALSAAFYVGAVIGSIAVASGRSLANGTSISDVLMTANRHNLNRPWLVTTLYRCPAIYDRSARVRNSRSYHAIHP